MRKTKFFKLLLLFLLIGLIGCTSKLRTNQGLVNRVKNRGPVPLSADNPYIAANLFLSKEAEAHPELQGFLSHRGIPAAMEVEQALFSPLYLKFYYPDDREYFNLEETPNTFLIDGPHRIPQEKMSEVVKVIRDITGQPLLDLSSSERQEEPPLLDSHEDSPEGQPDNLIPVPTSDKEPEDPFLSRLKEAEITQQQARKESFKSVTANPYLEREQPAPPQGSRVTDYYNTDNEAKHPAELTPNGDLVHYVTYSGETLYMISRWYTQNRDNAPKLARINSISNPDRLSIGDVVVIPSYLVKNKNRLTEKAVKALQIIALEERS